MSDVAETVHPAMTHVGECEAEPGHALDCATATRLARLTAFAEAVRDEIDCVGHDGDEEGTEHVDDCWHCGAEQALEPVR
jgi:hypothetical protein